MTLIDPRLIFEWQEMPMTKDEVGYLVNMLDAVESAFREGALAKRLVESHHNEMTGHIVMAKSAGNALRHFRGSTDKET